MTKPQRAYQIQLLRQLHTSPRYMNFYKDDRIAYKHFLKTNLGVESSRDLSIDALKNLVAYFEMKSDVIPTNKASNQQISFIRHLWSVHASNRDKEALLNFAKRTTKRFIKDINELNPKEASKVIAGVKKLKAPTFANNPDYKGG